MSTSVHPPSVSYKKNNYTVRFSKAYAPNQSAGEALYKGQNSVDEATLFQSLEAFVWDRTTDINYYWTLDDLCTGPENEAQSYVRITGVSFGYFAGEPITAFPVSIPEDEDYIRIYLDYRFSLDDDWISYETEGLFGPEVGVEYELMNARVVVLDSILRTEGETIDPVHIVNPYGQYADAWTDTINLLTYQRSLVGGRFTLLSTLFPGWKEDGGAVPFHYPVTAGRHVLEPAAAVPLTEAYQVEVETYWMLPDYTVAGIDEILSGASYIYAQTLTDYHGEDRENDTVAQLCVPQYVQAVQFNYYPGLTVGTLQLPDTVLYVDTTGMPSLDEDWLLYDRGLKVTDGYTVAEGNPRYTAKNGILYDLEMTQMLGVPTGVTTLTVGAQITKVVLPYQNSIKRLIREGESLDDLPEINYQRLHRGARIVVPDALFDDYLAMAGSILQRYGITVAAASMPEQGYLLRDNYLLTADFLLHSVQRTSAHWLNLPDYITGVESGALQPFIRQLEVLVLPESGQPLSFEQGCFDGFEKMTVACYSDKQQVAAQELCAQYPGCSFTIRRVTVRDDGYAWITLQDGVLLCAAPWQLETFDGMIPGVDGGEDIPVTVVGESAFADHYTLRWVVLPQQTSGIGYAAFSGCTNLEGVLIGTNGSFLLSENAFENCASLRFVASNAAGMLLEDTEFSLLDTPNSEYGHLYCLAAGSEKYNGNQTYLTDVTRYVLQDCGGTLVLYGTNEAGTPFVALRSGGRVSGDLTLPASTVTVFRGAFAGARSTQDAAFDVNWGDLTVLRTLWLEAFARSDIGEEITLPQNVEVGGRAFAYCERLKSITLPGQRIVNDAPTGGVQMGDEVFVDCTALKTVHIGEMVPDVGIPPTAFSGSAIENLIFEDKQPPTLLYYSLGMPFFFEYSQEAQGLLHITVPQGSEQAYLRTWRCELAGYGGDAIKTSYQVMWDEIEWQLYSSTWVQPTPQEIKTAVEETMLQAENRLRGLLGLPETQTLEKAYTTEWDDNGLITLTATDHIGSMTDLSASTIDLPYGWSLDYIAPGAFEGSPELRGVQVPSTLFAIWDGAFRGLSLDEADATDGLSLYLDNADSIFGLNLLQEGTPFDFGVPDDRLSIVSLDVLLGDEDALDTFVQLWTLPMAGYSKSSLLEAAVREALGPETDDEAVRAAMEAVLLPAENRVRALLEGAQPTEKLTFRFELTDPDDNRPAVDITIPEPQPETPALPGPDDAGQDAAGRPTQTPDAPDASQPEQPDASDAPDMPDAALPEENAGEESAPPDEEGTHAAGDDDGENTPDEQQQAAAEAAQKETAE